jgi:hypothetical protein
MFSIYCLVFCCAFLRLVYLMLPVFLDCSLFIAPRYSLTFTSIMTQYTAYYIYIIVLSVLHRFTASDNLFDIFKLFLLNINTHKKSLKIPKGQSESVYRRRTDNTMAKRKSTKNKQRSTKHTHKTKNQVTSAPLKTGAELRCSGRVSSSCSNSDTHVYSSRKPI